MTGQHRYNHFVIFVSILIVGLGLALALPWLANAQSLAAQSDVPTQDSAPEAATIYYVAITGTGLAPTVDWSGAYTNVQNALAVAVAPAEIWVAKGVYYPDVGSGQVDNALTSTFVMTDGVTLYGGFRYDDSDITDRNPKNNVTVLSGDIDWDNGGADVKDTYGVVITTSNIISANAYHVVSAKGVTGTAVLDGFTITAGKANGGKLPHIVGGGFLCNGGGSGNRCNPSLKNLTFSGNMAEYGGAMVDNGYNGSSSPSLTNVIFSGNSAEKGGAMYNNGDDTGTSSPSLTNVIFSGNSAEKGGAMYNYGNNKGTSSPSLTNVTFYGNSAGFDGGAMYNNGNDGDSNPTLTNVTFSGNKASTGGAMFNIGENNGKSNPTLKNVTFSGNSAVNYGGVMVNFTNSGGCTPEVYNSILWNNSTQGVTGSITENIENLSGATITLTHSLVEGSGGSGSWIGGDYKDGGGNLDEDPLFITPVDPATAPTEDGNLRLTMNSPAIDAGNNDFISVSFDLDNNPRKVDGDGDSEDTVDMGAYEYQPKHQLAVNKSGTGNGTVTSTPAGIDCGATCSASFMHSSTVTLTAVPTAGSIFIGWSGDCSDAGDCELTIDAAKSVTATFDMGLGNYLPLVNR